MGSRGVSDVVTVILLILITLAVIAIVFVFIYPFVSESGQQATSRAENCLSFILEPSRCTYSATNQVLVAVVPKPGSAAGTLSGARFSFTQGTDATSLAANATEFSSFKTYLFPFNLGFRPEEVRVAGTLSSGEACDPLANAVRCLPSVCGNDIVEGGEDCEGSSVSACTSSDPEDPFFGTGTCSSCRIPSCVRNPVCSDGLDNEDDGLCDFGGLCVSGTQGLPDPGCYNATDTDEDPARYSVAITNLLSGVELTTLALPYTLQFHASANELTPDERACWYVIDSGVSVPIPDGCGHGGQDLSTTISQQGLHTLTVYSQDLSGDVVHDTIDFTVLIGGVVLSNPREGTIYEDGAIPFGFQTGITQFSSCSYSFNNGVLNATLSSCTSSPSSVLVTQSGQAYNLTMFVNSQNGVTVRDDVRFIYDRCPGDVDGDLVIGLADISFIVIHDVQTPAECAQNDPSRSSYCSRADLNKDGLIDASTDTSILTRYWGRHYTSC